MKESKLKKILPKRQALDEEYEGQLAIDVLQTPDEMIIVAPIAGVKLKDISISVHDNTVQIKGHRMVKEDVAEEDYFIQECYWGPFSRSIILPSNVNTDEINAFFKDGIMRIVVPKTSPTGEKEINISNS